MTSQLAASKRLWKEYRDLVSPKTGLRQVKVEVDDDNVFLWNVVLLVIDPESAYYGGYLKGELRFPKNYPFSPPNFRFTPAIYHPNVYNDGRLCISILHEAGNEQFDEPDNETAEEPCDIEEVETLLVASGHDVAVIVTILISVMVSTCVVPLLVTTAAFLF